MFEKAIIHTPEEIEKIRRAAAMTAMVRSEVAAAVHAGMTTFDLDQIAGDVIRSTGGSSAFLGYGGFPGNICISVNEVVIHGIGSPEQVISDGDIVSVDVGVAFNGAVGDCATTVAVGKISDDATRLLRGTEKALQAGIAAARPGNYIRNISAAVEAVAKKYHLGIVRDFVGHGCGIKLHEPPEVPNYTLPSRGAALVPGMVICIEPMFTLGSYAVKVDRNDGWTVRTRDNSLSAHFENMILITESEPEILTWQKMM